MLQLREGKENQTWRNQVMAMQHSSHGVQYG
jgi:hypothetical protein